MKNVLMLVEYDGEGFHGWQRQPGQRTIQGTLEGALNQLLRKERVEVAGAGRTDAGVHASGQAVSFKADFKIPVSRIAHALNGLLPDDLAVLSAKEMPLAFHATRSAKSRVYVYSLRHATLPTPLFRRYTWQVKHKLHVAPMRQAASDLVGTHDFAAFQDVGSDLKGTIRTVLRSEVHAATPNEIQYEVEADRFLYNMVRIVMGTLVEIGSGKRRPDAVKKALQTKRRTDTGPTAIPRGLTLAQVKFGDVS